MREKALRFGRGKTLVGIVCAPTGGESSRDRPGIVILNAGVLHRVGPNRVHVQMARMLAEEGFTVLRFDLSGIGDSPPRDGAISVTDSVAEDLREALDLMEGMNGIRRFVLVGICSGADIALFGAIGEPRVAGAVLIDGFHVASFGYHMGLYRRRFISLRSWLRLLSGQSHPWSFVLDALADADRTRPTESAQRGPEYPTRAEYCEWVRSAVDRGTALLLVYTENSPSLYHYRRLLKGQIRRWAGRERITVQILDGSDHVFTLRTNQGRIVETVSRWVSAVASTHVIPAPSAPPPPPLDAHS